MINVIKPVVTIAEAMLIPTPIAIFFELSEPFPELKPPVEFMT